MSDDLAVSGGGSARIETSEMAELMARLDALAELAVRCSALLARELALLSSPPPLLCDHLRELIGDAQELGGLCSALSAALDRAADEYGSGEASAARAAELSAAEVSVVLGFMIRLAWPLLLIGGLVSSPLLLAFLAREGRLGGEALAVDRSKRRAILSDPAFVELVRRAVSSTDDIALGLAPIPVPLALALGPAGLGLGGVAATAAGVATGGALTGLLPARPSPSGYRATRVSPVAAEASPVAPPTGIHELALRIPRVSEGAPQLRIERYGESWIVYLGGTVDFGPEQGPEPFDLRSDLDLLAENDSASSDAVVATLEEAGIPDGATVSFVGHSQGGLIAAHLAESGRYRVPELVTFGSPIGQMDLPAETQTLAVEHSDDLVPALGGYARPAADEPGRIVLSRRALDENDLLGSGSSVPAHGLSLYQETAALADDSIEPRLVARRAVLAGMFSAGDGAVPEGEQSIWRVERSDSENPLASGEGERAASDGRGGAAGR